MHWLDECRRVGAVMPFSMATQLATWLRGAGFPERLLVYLIAQSAHETDGGISPLTKVNNWSGIKWSPNGYATGKQANGYATYKTPDLWAKDYFRVLSLAPGRPIDAISAQDFLDRLYRNGYFGKTKSGYNIYAAGLNRRLKEYAAGYGYDPSKGTTEIKYQGNSGNPTKPIGPITRESEAATHSQDPTGGRDPIVRLPGTPGKYVDQNRKSWFSEHPLLTGAGIAVLGVIAIKAVSK